MDFNSLTGTKTTAGSIANWINRNDLPTAEILYEAQAWIYQRLRVREMTAQVTGFTIPINTNSQALPADFLDPISFLPFQWGEPLPFSHEERMLIPTDGNGNLFTDTPSHWTIIGSTMIVDVNCAAAFSGFFYYYQLPAFLSSNNVTNFLTTRYPRLVRRTCMAIGYEHAKDQGQMQNYLTLAENDIAEAARTNEMWRRSQYVPA